MEVVIDFNINETASSIYMLTDRVQPLFRRLRASHDHADRIDINLCGCEYFGPVGVVVLGLLVRKLRTAGVAVTVTPPAYPQLMAYSQYSGFAELCWGGPPPVANHPQNETTPLVFSTERRNGDIQRVITLVERHSLMSQHMIESLKTLLGEVLQNIEDHAGAEGALSARWFPSDQTVRVVIADLGWGLRQTLADKHAPTSDKHALTLALKEKTTSKKGTRNFGNGLFMVHTLMKRNRGDLILVSGDAIFDLAGGDRGTPAKPSALGKQASFPGTLCALKFRIDHELYDGDDDDGADYNF